MFIIYECSTGEKNMAGLLTPVIALILCPPSSKIWGYTAFVLSICLSAKTLTLSITFDGWGYGFHISQVYSLWQDLQWSKIILILTLAFDPLFKKNLNIRHNFWTLKTRTFTFHRRIPCNKTFIWLPTLLIFWPLEFELHFRNFSIIISCHTGHQCFTNTSCFDKQSKECAIFSPKFIICI